MMKKSTLLLLTGAALQAAVKPNILWIVTDDQRLDSIEAFDLKPKEI